MKTIKLVEYTGTFAENKDVAASLRDKTVLPTLKNSEELTIDFSGVTGATQSFVHALISEAIRYFGPEVLDHIIFKSCNENVQEIVLMVTDYMQESM